VRLQELGIDQLLESVRDAVVVADARAGRIVLWNSAATKIFGYSSSEALEHSWTVFVPERLKAQCEAGMARYRDTGHGPYIDSNVVLELPAVRKDSEEITVEISLSPISLSHAAEYRGHLVLAIIRDVTERKQAEMRAKEAEFRYRALIENIPAIVYIVDVETQATLYDSPQIEAMLGYPANTCERDPHYWEKILHPEDRERMMAAEVAATERGEFKLEYRVLASDGRVVWLRDDAAIIRDEEGHPRFWQGVIFDITERKRTEEELRRLNQSLEQRVAQRTLRLQEALTELEERERGLRESEQLYRTVVEQAAENIFLVDTEPSGSSKPTRLSIDRWATQSRNCCR
jgi:PAS domain S-box-containing protein